VATYGKFVRLLAVDGALLIRLPLVIRLHVAAVLEVLAPAIEVEQLGQDPIVNR
jgi:hypothetical protein